MSEEREDTFLIAVTVTGQPSRSAARAEVYASMTRQIGFGIESWWDAGPDHTDRNDNGEAVWVHPGRGIEAQFSLVLLGLAPESDRMLGQHPAPRVARDQDMLDGNVIAYECARCGNAADSPEVLAEVPCIDLSKWEHGHYWTTDDEDPIQRITCLSDCGMTIEHGQAVGSVSAEAAGNPPE